MVAAAMKSLSQFINEARRNPHLNPKVPVNQEIKNHLDSAKKLPGSRLKNSFVSFTSVDKLGINPGSTYDTPLGIYSYPSQYVHYKTGAGYGEMSRLPFAGKSPYVNIFSVRGNIVDVSEMNDSDLRKYYKKITDVYLDAVGSSRGTDEWKRNVDAIERIINSASSRAKFSEYAGGRFWYVTMEVASLLIEESREWGRNKHSVAWNKLFREIGIDGCVDLGRGIIHTAEPAQAVFFSKRAIRKNRRVYNKYSPKYMERKRKEGQMMRDIVRSGPWEGFEWEGGTWTGGTWYDGVWESGRWKRGTWKNGYWEDGIWEGGTWERGDWMDGTWERGTWERGTWNYGIWKGGRWMDGRWMDGTWEGGTWMGGFWHNGIWLGGTWLGGYDKHGNYHPEGDSPDKW